MFTKLIVWYLQNFGLCVSQGSVLVNFDVMFHGRVDVMVVEQELVSCLQNAPVGKLTINISSIHITGTNTASTVLLHHPTTIPTTLTPFSTFILLFHPLHNRILSTSTILLYHPQSTLVQGLLAEISKCK